MASGNSVQSLARGLALLDAMADGDGRGAKLTELARRTGLSASTAHRLLATLIDEGYAVRDRESGLYVPGHRIVGIASSIWRRTAYLRALARSHLENIAARTGETTNLVVLDHARSVYIDQAEGVRALRMAIRVGSTFPAHTSASAKAILAHQRDDRALRVVFAEEPLPALTARTIVTAAAFRAELQAVRRRRYAIEREELEEGVSCVAAPIRGRDGIAIAALSLPGPTQRILGKDPARLGLLLVRHATEISRALNLVGGANGAAASTSASARGKA